MYDRFCAAYKVDVGLTDSVPGNKVKLAHGAVTGIDDFFLAFNGASFNSGLYRALQADQIQMWERMIHEMFPRFPGTILPFGYDWLGRFFCVHFERVSQDEPQIVLVCPYSNDILDIPSDFVGFHNNVLVDQMRPAVEDELFAKFIRANNMDSIPHDKCAGLIVPTFLRGQFAIENMKLTDLEVYWDITAQLLSQVRDLPPGTPVKGISLQIN